MTASQFNLSDNFVPINDEERESDREAMQAIATRWGLLSESSGVSQDEDCFLE
jgi:hypothetical protein